MSLMFARLFLPALVVIVMAAILLITYLVLTGESADERLLGPFRWMGTGADVA